MLNFFKNNFVESQIPSEIARLKQLRILDLSFSGFNGQIPNEISHLIQLFSLDLSGNPLKLQSPGLEYLLKNMTRLESLHLYEVDLSSSVPRFLANFSSMRSIILAGCQLQDEFPSAIFHLPNLKYLDMENNSDLTGSLPEFQNNTLLEYFNLHSTGFTGIIPESIGKLKNLDYLSLSNCNFLGRIPGSLPNLTQLTFLSLSENEFTGPVPSLASLSKLNVLVLGNNRFGIDQVYDWIKKLTKLYLLDLNRMSIHHEILPCLANLTKLSTVLMAGNSIFGHIPSSFMNLTQLRLIDLNFNKLKGPISSSFLNLKSLQELYIASNNFSGTVSLDSFSGLDKLETLSLDGNCLSFVTTTNYTNATLPKLKFLGLSSCNLQEFPAFLRFQTKMIALTLYDNQIEGLVPNWGWNNSQETLRIIGLGSNFITGFQQHPRLLAWNRLEGFDVAYNGLIYNELPIPRKTIVFYDVSNNNLAGEIPSWICDMKSLQLLDLSSNKMTGALPPCLGKFNNLLILDLKQKNLNGPMMDICTHGSFLKIIDLSENQFTGKVTKSLANCTNLEFLSLGNNYFEDVFPLWLGTLPKLQVLILRSNKFYGAIQGLSTSSSQFNNLRIIDISSNAFSGHLPDKSFQTWNAMKHVYLGRESSAIGTAIHLDELAPFWFGYSMKLTNTGVKTEYIKIQNKLTAIDLSCSKFEGQIPQSLQDLLELHSLNLSNNHFTGPILPSLGNLQNLESLDLFQNELSGKIPQELVQLVFLSTLNVSFNHLDGRIPQGKQFDAFDNSSYLGNSELCGKPLSEECEKPKVPSTLPPTSSNEYDFLLPSDKIDWTVILLGVGFGFVIGIIIGNFVYTMNRDWLLERFGMRNYRWLKPLSNTRKNYSPS